MTMQVFEFNTRDEYVSWRAHWRAEYADLTAKILKMKHDVKFAQRHWSGGGDLQLALTFLRERAKVMMEQRMEAKARWASLRPQLPLAA